MLFTAKGETMGSLHNNSNLSNSLWSIILSGGEGQRMRPFIEGWLGRHIPKQYCTFVGTRSMLQHTWDRADQLTYPYQKVTVLARTHQNFVWPEAQPVTAGRFIFQPKNRDTAAGVFLPLTYVRSWNPEATVIVYPSDHFIYPEDVFMKQVGAAVRATEHWTDRIILLGAAPAGRELDYGWVEKRRRLGWANGGALWSVGSFKEKPSSLPIWAPSESRWLWNTMVVVTKLKTLWNIGWQSFPALMERFTRLGEAIGTQKEGAILDTIYADMPRHNFSSELLGQAVDQLGVMEMRNLLWSDWGRPDRILETLKDVGKVPCFPMELFAPNYSNGHFPKEIVKIGQRIEGVI